PPSRVPRAGRDRLHRPVALPARAPRASPAPVRRRAAAGDGADRQLHESGTVGRSVADGGDRERHPGRVRRVRARAPRDRAGRVGRERAEQHGQENRQQRPPVDGYGHHDPALGWWRSARDPGDADRHDAAARGDESRDPCRDRSVTSDFAHHHAPPDRCSRAALLRRPGLLPADARQPAGLGHARLRRLPAVHRQPDHSPADGDHMNALPILIGVAAAVGAYLLTVGIIASRAADAATMARERLARQEVGLGQSAVALEMEKPLGQRLTAPMRRWLDRQMMRMTPEAQAAHYRRQLDFAGNPLNLDPAGLQTLRIAAAAALGAIGTAIGMFLGTPIAIGIALVAGVAIGFYVPVIWLEQLVRERRTELEASLPNALDVVAISMEAGLGLDRALEQLVRHQDDSLTLLVARALREIQLGRPRAAALVEMAEATGIEDFTSLVRGILYAERTGVPIARTIAAHAAQMRVKRRLKIRTEAARASLKILLPTVGCVFPTLWLVLLGPALLVVLTLGSK